MSSMTRVMQKIREDAPTGESANVPTESFETPAATAPFEEASGVASGFVEEPAVAPQPRSVPVTPLEAKTREWDRRQVDPAVIAFHDRYSPICEKYRAARARLLNVNSQHRSQVLAITSSVPQEGKSVSTLNLGLVMAEGGEKRTVIVDADLRRPSLARMLGAPAQPGLADVLRGSARLEDALQTTPLPNLRFLPAGNAADASGAELLSSSGAAAALKELRARFDYVLLDTPPVTTVSDVCLLAPGCDGVILVVRMGRSPAPIVVQAVQTLKANKVPVLGCLLSHARDSKTQARYACYYAPRGRQS